MYGVMAAKRATGGIVVTSRSFTENAKAFADGRNVKLVDGHRLFALIKQTRESLAARTGTSERPTPVAAPAWGPEVVPECIDDLLREASE